MEFMRLSRRTFRIENDPKEVFMSRLVATLSMGIMLSACGTGSYIAERQAIAKTTFELASVALQSADLPIGANPGAHLKVALNVTNPNSVTARLDKLDYQIFMDGTHVGTGALDQEFSVASGQTGVLELPVFVPYLNLPTTAAQALQTRKAMVTLKGVSHLATPFGAIDFPVEVGREVTF
jgi:LEA14-like dessication related protein